MNFTLETFEAQKEAFFEMCDKHTILKARSSKLFKMYQEVCFEDQELAHMINDQEQKVNKELIALEKTMEEFRTQRFSKAQLKAMRDEYKNRK